MCFLLTVLYYILFFYKKNTKNVPVLHKHKLRVTRSSTSFNCTLCKYFLPIQIRQKASVQPHRLSHIFLCWPTLNPLRLNWLDNQPAAATPGTIKSHGTTLKIQLWAWGKLSWKYVGNHDSSMKKQLFWQKWQMAHALIIKKPSYWLPPKEIEIILILTTVLLIWDMWAKVLDFQD